MRNNNNVKSEFWNSDVFYQKELERIWSIYEHEPDVKELNQNWRSWERESLDKK